MGRPSLKTPELIEAICDAIADGQSLRSICEHDTMPDRKTVRRWLDEDAAFAAKHARAREAQADVMDERIAEVADACTADTAAADRVKIGAYQWRAERLNVRRYGKTLGVGQAEGLDAMAVHAIDRRIVDAHPAD
jgi:hypothetical protein